MARNTRVTAPANRRGRCATRGLPEWAREESLRCRASPRRARVSRDIRRSRARKVSTSRVVANSSPRQTHERRVLHDENHEGASFAFCAGISRGWARAGGRGESRSLHRRVARTPPLADRMGRKSLRVSPREGAGLRLRRARWSGHYPLVSRLGSGALGRGALARDPLPLTPAHGLKLP